MTIDLFCDGLIPKDSTLTTCWNSMLWLDPQQQRAERGRHSKNSSILEQSPSLSMLKMSMEDMLFKQNHTTRHKTKHTGKASGSGKIRVLEYYFVYILEIFRRTANAICQSCFWHPKPPVGFQWNMTGWRCGIVFIFPYIGNNHPNWRTHIFQWGRSTTNQIRKKGGIPVNFRRKTHGTPLCSQAQSAPSNSSPWFPVRIPKWLEVNKQFAIEGGHRNSGCSHKKWVDLSIVFWYVDQAG